MDVVLDVPIVAVATSGAVALFVYLVDRRRARLADKGHRGAIARSMGDLDEVVTHVMLGVRDLDVHESDETIPERLSQYLERNYRRTEIAAGAIEMHGAMCTALSDQEKSVVYENYVQLGSWVQLVSAGHLRRSFPLLLHPQGVGPAHLLAGLP